MHPDGYIEVKDRSKDIIISGGENISSLEIEDVPLSAIRAVLEAAVVARPRRKWGETPCAFVVRSRGGGAQSAERQVIAWCRERSRSGFKCAEQTWCLVRAAEDLDREDPEVRAAGSRAVP